MSGIFIICFLLLAAAISLFFGLLSPHFETRAKGLLITAVCLGLIAGILYLTQWSQSSVALY